MTPLRGPRSGTDPDSGALRPGSRARPAVLATLALAVLAWSGTARAATRKEAAESRDWFKMVTPRFELYGNTRPQEARRLLRELETFQFVVSRFLGLTNVQHRPALVYLFRDEESFVPYKPRFRGRPRPVSGFHVNDPSDQVLALSRQPRGSATMRVMFHEYTHLLTARQFRYAPLWAFEGVAEVFSSFEGSDDRFDIGVALTNHVRGLQREAPLPVEQLLQVGRDAPDYNEQERAGRFYASSWLLCHYLLFGRTGYASNALPRYAAVSATQTNRVAAFREAFGTTPEAADADLRRYLQGGNYVMVRQTYPDLADAEPREVRMGPGELDLALGRLLYHTDQGEPARERLERAAAAMPGDPRPPAALAMLAWRLKDREALRARAADALRLGTSNAFVHYLAAEIRYQEFASRPRTPDAGAMADLREGRKWCERAAQLDPWMAQAHHLLGVYVLAEHPRTPALAATHVQQALRCDPFYQPALITWASLLAAQGNLGTARQVLDRLLASPLSPEIRDAALGVRESVNRRLSPARPEPRSP